MKKTWVKITSSAPIISSCTPYLVTGSIGILDEKTAAYCSVHQKSAFAITIILLNGTEIIWKENHLWAILCKDNFIKIKSKEATKLVLEAVLRD